MSDSKHIPVRMCIGCRERKSKVELIRIVKRADSENEEKNDYKQVLVSIDKTHKVPGRGAYICKDPKCFKGIIKKQKLQRALRTKVPAKLISELEEIIND